ncbi:hypothetical protein [Microbacterium arborescens]
MGNAARKARKRAGEKFSKPVKRPSRAWRSSRDRPGLGLVSPAEVIAALVTRGLL